MAKSGRPTKYRKDFHPQDFIDRSRRGKNITQIARDWDITRETIYDWQRKFPLFSDAVKRGKSYCEAWYMDLGMAAMVGKAQVDGKPIVFNLGAFVWMTKNVLKWSDKVENTVEHSGEVHSGENRKKSLNQIFKTEKSRALALELAEEMCARELQLIKEEKDK